MIEKCQHCGAGKLLYTDTAANGGYGPSFLPGTGFFKPGKFRIVICESCGFVHWFVAPADLQKVKESRHFQPIHAARN